MEKIGRFLKGHLERSGLGARLQEASIFQRWPEVVGPEVAARAVPRAIRNKVLLVETKSAAWSNQLTLLKPQLFAALDRTVGKGLVKEIKFQVTPWRDPGAALMTEKIQPPCPLLPMLSPEDRTLIEAQVGEQVEDPELKKTVVGFLEVLKRRQLAKEKAGYRICACGALFDGKGATCPICQLGSHP